MPSLGPLLRITWLAVLFAARAATAEAAPDDFLYIGPNASTLGPGMEMSARMNDWFVLRVGGHYAEFTFRSKYDGIPYRMDADAANAGAALDLHPFENGFLISAGVFWNGNKADMVSKSSSASVNVGSATFTQAQVGTINGKLRYDSVVPYVGIGYDNASFAKGPWSITVRAGLFFMGGAEVRLRATGTLAGDPAFQANLSREEERLEDEFDVLSFYPAVTIGFKYRF